MLIIHKYSSIHGSTVENFLFSVIIWILTHIPLPILKLILLLFDVFVYWFGSIYDKFKNSPDRILLYKLNHSTSWSEFSKTAFDLDNYFNNDIWKNNLVSSKYDYVLIQERLHDLRNARLSNNFQHMLSLLRAGMLRNLGGISNKSLYNRTYIGTKSLIEQYNKEVTNCLESLDKDPFIDNQLKLDFYHDAKTTLGATALCLHGGSLFGMGHIGVVKSLLDQNLLPNVLVGSGVGSVVGALVGCLEKEELVEILVNLKNVMQEEGYGLKPKNCNDPIESTQIGLKWIENIKKGVTKEMKLFIDFVLSKVGGMTFKQAHEKTGKTFNILVYPKSSKLPTLLNYLSTPYITMESAIRCSLGTGVLKDKIPTLEIKFRGDITKYSNVQCDFQPPYQVRGQSIELKNSPYNRITEMFNVNHFVISISRPYLASFVSMRWRRIYNYNSLLKKLLNIINIELKHRIRMLNRFGLLNTPLRWLLVDEKSVLVDTNHIAIIPTGTRWILWDFIDLFVQNKSVMNYWIECGERSVWSMHSLLETRSRAEFLLDEYFQKYR
ncbi:hypothetical protein CAS74_001456 [Pichia kudriavzevii]|uniref:PNPLA domain-containing protein n=1 Tax=Pichia kudriavzevii TaxID=4909 RepID=A0A1Z8JRC6_PICKU|nr:hypothetical protein CAS74_001456 [Pichia kudriavzevii]